MVFEEQGIYRSFMAFLDLINSYNHIVIVYDKKSKEEYTEEIERLPKEKREFIYTFDEILSIFRKILLNYPK